MNKLTFIIPIYNEEGAIGKTIDSIRKIFNDVKIVVCDNNSSDKSLSEALEKNVKVLSENKKGKGYAVSKLFRSIDSEVYILVDGDNTYDLSCLKDALKIFKNKKLDMMIGNRFFYKNSSYIERDMILEIYFLQNFLKSIWNKN